MVDEIVKPGRMKLRKAKSVSTEVASDADLLRQIAQEKSDEALNAFFLRHRNYVYRLAVRFCRNTEDAEDIAQKSFLKVIQLADRFESDKSAKAWIGSIVLNLSRNHYVAGRRRRTREEKYKNRLPLEVDQKVSSQETLNVVREEVEQLPDQLRTVISLRYFENLSIAELAVVLNIREGSTKNLVSRALHSLRSRLARRNISVSEAGLAGVLSAFSYSATNLNTLPTEMNDNLFAAAQEPDQFSGEETSAIHSSASFILLGGILSAFIVFWGITWTDHSKNTGLGGLDVLAKAEENEDKNYLSQKYEFADGIPKGLKLIAGDASVWPETPDRKAVFASSPILGSVLCLTDKRTDRPFLLRVFERKLKPRPRALLSLVWGNEKSILPFTPRKVKLNNEQRDRAIVEFYGYQNKIVRVVNDKPEIALTFDQKKGNQKLLLFLGNMFIEKLELREIPLEEIPLEYRKQNEELIPNSLIISRQTEHHLNNTMSKILKNGVKVLHQFKWTFEDGLSPELKTISFLGWEKDGVAKKGYMVLPVMPVVKTKALCFVVPNSSAIHPILVRVQAIHRNSEFKSELQFNVPSPASNNLEWVEIASEADKGNEQIFEFLLDRNFIAKSENSRLLQIGKFEKLFFFNDIKLWGYNYKIESIECIELKRNKIPKQFQDLYRKFHNN